MSVLEFISSLKWPVVVLVGIFVVSRGFKRNPDMGVWFRRWLDSRDVKAKGAGFELEATASRAVAAAASVAAASDERLVAELDASVTQADGEPASPAEVEGLRREAVETLMRDAASWGWEMAGMGFRTPPDPQVEWDIDGYPTIRYGAGGLISRTVVSHPGLARERASEPHAD